MTPEALKSHTRKTLATMARRRGVEGWHAMRKDQLVDALLSLSTPKSTSPNKAARSSRPARPSRPRVQGRPVVTYLTESPRRDLAAHGSDEPLEVKERFVVMVRGPYWLHAHWQFHRNTINRAAAALGLDWHTAVPVIRLLDVTTEGESPAAETLIRDIEIHGGVNHWYVNVEGKQRAYKLHIGYRTRNGRFYVLARSNTVTTPRPGAASDDNWQEIDEQGERVFSLSGGNSEAHVQSPLRDLFEERLGRPMGGPAVNGLGAGLQGNPAELKLQLGAEIIVRGSTDAKAHITLQGEPLTVRPDGTFVMKLNLDEGRHVIPIVATSADGSQQRTVIVAIERNTKELEPQSFEDN
jgi:hypothetical protein